MAPEHEVAMRKLSLLGVAFALLCALSYSVNPVLGKLAYAYGLTTVTILQGRFFFAVLGMILVFPFIDKTVVKPTKGELKSSFIIGVLILVPMNMLYVFSLKGIPASLMSLITYLYPLAVLLMSRVLLGKSIRKNQALSIGLIVLGGFCVFSDALMVHIEMTTLAIAVVAMLFYALYMVAFEGLGNGKNPFHMTFWTLLICTLGLFFIPSGQSLFSLNVAQWGVCLAYGVISTIFATVFLFLAIDKLGATEAGIFCSFEPIFTILFSALILGEDITLVRFLGMLLLVGAIVIPNYRELFRSRSQTVAHRMVGMEKVSKS